MICDTLENSNFYRLGKAFEEAVEFVQSLNMSTPLGRHELSGGMYASVMEYDTVDKVPEKYEVHRRYVDLLVLISGSEGLFVRPSAGLDGMVPYDEEKDCEFLAPDGKSLYTKLKLVPGYFALLFPQDAHMGGSIAFSGCGMIRKVVVKIPLDQLF